MSKDTELIHAGRDPRQYHGLVNTPVYRGSTVLFPTLDALENATRRPHEGVYYGRFGTPTHHALQRAISELEGAHGTVLASSGLGAIHLALTSFLRAGDHVLVADSVYQPTRWLCDGLLARLGIEATYFDPALADLSAHFRKNTRVLMLESPGSLSFEVLDIPALSAQAHARDAVVICDNTWATPLFCNPLALGADVVLHALTKYVVGHADAMLGTVSANEQHFTTLRDTAAMSGAYASPDDCYLALRGLRTLAARLRVHQGNALALAGWLEGRPEIERVIHPALPSHPGFELWRRDFRGASGLFSAVLRPVTREVLARFCDGLKLFGMGFSWGGYESLVLPVQPQKLRTAYAWPHEGVTLRFHAGLEDVADLVVDLDAAFARLAG
jgi:cystathionine beta-lyase